VSGVNEALTSSRMSVHSFNTVTVNFPKEQPRATAQYTILSVCVCGSQHQRLQTFLCKVGKNHLWRLTYPEHTKHGMMKKRHLLSRITLRSLSNMGVLVTVDY